MHRRSKLAILVLFLALLSVPAVYVARTWSFQDPLRVYFDPEVAFETRKLRSDGLAPLAVVLENTSATPVHITSLWIMTPNDLPRRRSQVYADESSLKNFYLTVPPHGRVRTYLLPYDFTLAEVDGGTLWVGYRGLSGSKATTLRYTGWIPHCLPESWRRHLPPTMEDECITALPIPAGTAASYGVEVDGPERLPQPAPQADTRAR